MKKKGKRFRVIGSICAVFCWWGLLYPELTMTPDTYAIFWEDESLIPEKKQLQADTGDNIYRMILEAEDGRIRFRSKLWEYLMSE